MSKLDASKGGKARAMKLSPEERSEIARVAAEARWGSETPRATYDGVLEIGGMEFPCAVLSDGKRVLTETDFMKGMEMYRSGALSVRRGGRGAQIPLYLAFKNLKPFVDEHLGDVHTLKYRTPSGNLAHGIPAEIIPKICEVWLDARNAGVLGKRQVEVAKRADILLRGLANVGIIALVDEATGYQDARSRDALARILEQFIAKELRKWVKTFPPDFYTEMFRLRGIADVPIGGQMPRYVGHLTNNLVYDRLAPGVRAELKRLTPRDASGRHKNKLHQRLSEDVGNPKLKEHLAAVVAIMQGYNDGDWDGFMSHLDRAKPRYGTTIEMPFPLSRKDE